MSSTRPSVRQRRHPLQPARWQRTLLSSAVLAATVAGAASPGLVQAQVKSAWFASGNMSNPGVATRQRALPMPAQHGPGAQAQVAQSRERLQHSLQNVGRTAAAIAAQQAAQNAARQAALQAPSAVPDGLGAGGLEAATGAQARWDGAAAARQSTQNGRQRVDIDQTSSRAVLHWDTFNVGRNTDLHFNQQSGDAVLNRVVGAQATPSQILGKVQADGTVLVINQNGVVFGGASQVNVRNLVASAVNIKDEQFAKGLYGDVVDGQAEPTFANALKRINGKAVFDPATAGVTVEPGAQIRTHASESVTSGGGYVLLLGREVRNDGVVQTPGGQTVMAAGDAFVIRKGLASEGDRTATTRGQQVSTLATADSRSGRVVNTGLIQAREGDVTLAGRELRQQGVLLSSTSVNTRGTVHLKAGGADATLELAPGSVTAIALESGAGAALDVQRKNRLQESGADNDLGFRDRRDQSLIAILSDSTIAFQDQSLVMATGGQIYVRAQKETQVQNGARLDVSGAVGVQLAMAANAVEVNVQGNEQRDAPLNRDSRQLNNSNLWVDRRSLVYVPAGAQGYDADRWYTAGGLLEVSGYLGTQGHTTGEWMASGGTVMVEGGRLTTQAGSQINLSGGTYEVQSGWMPLSWLRGADGRLYEASRAPGDLLYDGVYDGYVREHVRWGVSNRYRNPLIGPQRRFEHGYTVGRDAGRLQLAVQELDLAGEVLTTVYQGPRQIHAAQTPDPYMQGHMMLARRGQLVVGRPQATFHSASQYLVDTPFAVAGSLVVGEDEKADLQLSADWINSQDWGRVSLVAKERLDVQQALRVDAGGQIELHAQAVEVGADLTAPGGRIALGNVMQRYNNGSNIWEQLALSNDIGAGPEEVRVRGGARLDVSGVALPQARDNRTPAYVDGGRILLETSGDIILEAGSALDASSGHWSTALEQLQGGKGGSVSLLAGQVLRRGLLTVDGDIRAFGWTGGGTLTAKSSGHLIVGEGGPDWGTEGWKDYGMAETLAEDYVILPGERSPFPFIGKQTWLQSGVVLDVGMTPTVSRDTPVVTQAAWVLPRGVNVQGLVSGVWMGNRGQTVPAGTAVRFISLLPAGLVLPADVFPAGLPIQAVPREFKAGEITPQELRLARGTYLPPGTSFVRAPVLVGASRLAPSLLHSGFSRYVLNGGAGLVVPEQTRLAIAMPTYVERQGRASLELPQLYTVNNRARTITQRPGASLSLQAGNTQFSAHLLVAQNASLSVDPGQSITLAGNDQITLLGELHAPGGTVSLVPGERIPGSLQTDAQGDAARTGRSIWLGEQSVIDVSGLAVQSVDRLGRRFGTVRGGGTAQVGAYFKLGATEVNAFDGFVIMRPGAQIRADGASVELDVPRSGAQTVYGRAGTIAFSANNGLVLDGSLQAGLRGGAGMGGLLAINLETPIYGRVDRATFKGPDVPDEVRVPRELFLTQEHALYHLPVDLKPGQYDDSLGYAQARVGVDLVSRGGFDGLSLMVNGLLSTDGRIHADLGRELWLTVTALGLQEQAESSQVRLAAPYVRLAGTTRRGVESGLMPSVMFGGGNYSNGGGPRGVPKTQMESSLTLEAGHMDVQGSFMFGAMGDIIQNKIQALRVDRLGFEQVNLRSQGDLRFGAGETKIYTPGSVELAARQIYPASHAQAELTVGMASLVDPQWGNIRQYVRKDSKLTLRSTGPVPEALPYSVFGSLTLKAMTVEQGGVLRAPLGNLTIGVNDYLGDSSLLHFLPGSVTSVSAHGLVMPYGGTADGLNYLYAGNPVEFRGQGSNPSIRLNGQQVKADAGSEFDLRGGGELLGAAFLTGRGGSVDARLAPMIRYDAKSGRFSLPDPSSNKVYAIVPANGGAYAPLISENGAGAPELGANITIPAGVPGLPAGTYTLMPSSFALLPGAFRVEVHANRSLPGAPGPQPMRNGSWTSSAVLGQAQVAQTGGLPVAVTLTGGEVLRRHSQYNETSYAQFAALQAQTYGIPLPVLERDGARLVLQAARMDAERAAQGETALRFDGKARFEGAASGFGGILELESGRNFEILGNDAAPTQGFAGVSLRADQLNRLEASSLMIGGRLRSNYFLENRPNQAASNQLTAVSSTGNVTVRSGAQLRAADVFLFGNHITIEQGASIMTLGRAGRTPSAAEGFIIDPNNVNMLAVSNSVLDVLPSWRLTAAKAPGAIRVGVCLSVCEGLSRLYSEGTITAATSQPFELGDALRYGTRNLILSVGAINIGERAELSGLAAQGRLPDGLALDQAMMSTLLRGDREFNAPALERLVLKARESVNFYGDVTLSTLDPATGRSSLSQLVLGTPAIYGWGREGQTARLQTDSLVWEGARDEPGATVTQSAGQGAGRLLLDVQRLTLGYAPNSQVDSVHDMNRVVLGFGRVDIEAAEHVTSSNLGSLSVYQSRDTQGAGQGGQLTVRTPLLTGEHGSILRVSAGGDVLIEGGRAGYAPSLQADRSLGADLSVQAGGRLLFNTLAMLPSGKLSLSAGQDVQLGAQAHADLAGRRIDLFDVANYSWGGDLALSSRQGQVRVDAGALIDLSAQNNQGGRLSVTALDDQRGRFVLDGRVMASATGEYDAGGTWVPFSQGGAEVRVAHMDEFAALNQRLNEGSVTGMRRFQIRHGDLTVVDELRASEISLSLDNGALQVAGRIDASGPSVGSIRLSAGHGVTLRSGAVLDAHGRTLRVDSYGQVIAAPNRAHIEINAGQGELNIQPGALLDLRAGTDGQQAVSLGTLALYAPRLHHAVSGDLAIQARSGIATPGARRIDLYAVQRYADAPLIQGDTVDGRDYQSITQDYLDDKHDDSVDFMNAARRNASLLERVAGLRADPARFHLRPAVELRSAAADGDLHVDGDLDLSRYRYDGLIPAHQRSGVYGSGEAGALILRAGGNLEFFGSVSDGFDVSRLTAVDDDKGWVLPRGVAPWGGELIIPHSGMVTLGAGTKFLAGHVLNYDLPVQAQVLAAQTRLPAQARLTTSLDLPAGMALGGDIRAADGSVLYAAGSVLDRNVTLPASTLLGAGLTLPVDASIGAMIWPKGTVLPDVVLAQDLPLAKGARIPSETDVVLPNSADTVDLRPRDAQGNMGRTLSLAPMLAAGLDSWDLRLVAGADLRAADTRLTVPGGDAVARLQMHDTHYGLKYELAPVAGTGRPATYAWNPHMTDDEFASMEMFGMTPRPGQQLNDDDMTYFEAYGGMEFNEWGFGVAWNELDPGTPPDYAMQGRPATQQLFSVLRTGTGDLDLISAGNIGMSSPYGVYTAGTPSAALDSGVRYGFDLARGKNGTGTILGAVNADLERLVDRTHADNLYHAWYPESGGNVLLRAGGSLHGDIVGVKEGSLRNGPFGYYRADAGGSGNVGHWLWRQGSGDIASGADRVPTAWWINFGTYVDKVEVQNLYAEERQLVGFTGFGTLGGGNLVVEASADAGMRVQRGDLSNFYAPHSSGLNLTVASTGRVLGDGTLVQTGGGDLHVRIGGRLNAEHELRAFRRPGQTDMPSAAIRLEHSSPELNGTFTNLRGATHLVAGAVGGLELRYDQRDPTDSRGPSPFSSSSAIAGGGLTLVLGDSTARLDTRGDLVLNGAGDPGRVSQYGYGSAFTARGRDRTGNGYSWFSLWTPASAIQLFSAGGHVAPTTAWSRAQGGLNYSATDGRYVYPSLFSAVSASGSLFYGNATSGRVADNVAEQSATGVVLAPRPVGPQFVSQGSSGQLNLMARQSIFGSDYLFSMSGADPTLLPSPWKPGFVGVTDSFWAGWQRVSNVSQSAIAPGILIDNSHSPDLSGRAQYALFSMTPPTASGYQYAEQSPARYYAAEGDLVGIRVGSVITRNTNLRDTGSLPAWYESGGTVQMRAGRDIVNAGTTLGGSRSSNIHALGWQSVLSRADASLPGRPMRYSTGVEYGNLIVHRNPDDISILQAGGDIRYSSFYVAGPGELVLMAGGDVFMADKGELRSIGDVLHTAPGQRGGGAGITVLAGVGAQGPDYAAFIQRYLMTDPARLPAGSTSYAQELTLPQWLTREFGFQGKPEDAPAFLREQQAKLDASGSAKRNLSSEFEQQSQLHLVNWLQTRFGGANGLGLNFDAQRDDARAFFQALPPEQRQSYLQSVYFAELKASGREYNGAGLRAGSYARGREAIATLFPQGVERSGGLTMFSSALYYDGTEFVLTRPKTGVNYVRYDEWLARGRPYGVNYYKALDSGIHTDFGGHVRVLTPGGQTLVGVDGGFTPDAGSGILTQGSGDIQIYSRDSILLGQSRIFTTFGGHILAWSEHGDINAGRGSKSTVVYTPQLRVYDFLGNVTLSPSTPSTGAGIATLNPIPEVPAGDIDLVAPEGTIDAGEAGIRVSGNVNLAAMHVANAANIKVQGESKGIPVVAVVNTAALTSASSAAGSATAAADAALQRSRQQSRQNQPSVIQVQILGFGQEQAAAQPGSAQPYLPQAALQVVGAGELSAGQRQQLTPQERSRLL